MLVISNNPLVRDRLSDSGNQLIWVSGEYEDVLIAARNRLHMGHRLLTHPLAGSIKPNETPYRTILLSADSESLHLPSLEIMEQAFSLLNSFKDGSGSLDAQRTFREEHLPDLQLVDSGLLEAAFHQQPTIQEGFRKQERGETA